MKAESLNSAHTKPASSNTGKHPCPKHVGPSKQRGVALIFTAFILLGLVTALALAIDVGRLYAAQQSLQTAADIAALETSRFVGGCRDLPENSSLLDIAQNAVNRNFANSGSSPVVNPSDIATGVVQTVDGLRQIGATPNGVRDSAVALNVTDDNFSPLFLNLLGGVSGLTASAAATNRPEGEISIGSTLAGLNPTLLADLLPINTGALQQGDLANVSISLADLIGVDAGVVTREQLLETSLNEALQNIGSNVSGQVAGVLNDIAGLLPTGGDAPSLLNVLDIAGEVGGDLAVNAASVVNAVAQLAASQRRDSPIPLLLGDAGVPGVANVSANIRILEPPVIAAGPAGLRSPPDDFFTEAQTAQIAIELSVSLLGLLDLPLVIEGARAGTALANIACGTSNQPFHRVTLDSDSAVLRAGIGRLRDLDGDGDLEFEPGEATLLRVFLVGDVLTATGTAEVLSSASEADFEIQDLQEDLPASAGVGGVLTTQQLLSGLLSSLNLTPNVLGILPLPLGQLLSPINALLAGPLSAILAPVLDPVLQGLGLSLGTGQAQLLALDVDQSELFCSRNCLQPLASSQP